VISAVIIARAEGVNLKAAPGTTFATDALAQVATALAQQQVTGDTLRFIPLHCFAVIRTMTGPALTTAPTIRVGTNATHNNIAPPFTPPVGATVGIVGVLPLASPLSLVPIDSANAFVEVTASAVGPTTMTGDVLVFGLLVG
jgi:hypothetical protein